jgi:hypothetical protein
MKFDLKSSTVLIFGGIALAVAFLITAVVSPESLNWILPSGDETNDQIKKEMERQQKIGANGQSNGQLRSPEETKSAAITPTPSPEETVQPEVEERRRDARTPRPECISRDQVVKIIGASEEATEGRVIAISVAPDGRQIIVAYRKKKFMGIGSGENQIEGILQRGLRGSFPDRLIKSLKVRSDGNRSIQRGERKVDVEVLKIETLQEGCRWS